MGESRRSVRTLCPLALQSKPGRASRCSSWHPSSRDVAHGKPCQPLEAWFSSGRLIPSVCLPTGALHSLDGATSSIFSLIDVPCARAIVDMCLILTSRTRPPTSRIYDTDWFALSLTHSVHITRPLPGVRDEHGPLSYLNPQSRAIP